ncbi:MAG TPA: hypothetical protein VIQ03_00140 [Gammaproteobacteria bacterium]
MFKNNKKLSSSLVLMLGILVSTSSHAINYAIKNLGTLGGAFSSATAINNQGVVVGYSENADTRNVSFIYENNAMTALGNMPDTTFNLAYDINDSNTIVGSSSVPYIYQNGAVETINLKGRATHINNNNQTIGFILPSTSSTEPGYGFLYEAGNLINFRTLLNSSYATVSGINDKGEVIVNADTNTYMYHNGTFKLLSISGGVTDITNTSEMLCYVTGADGKYDICKYSNGIQQIIGDFNNLSTVAYSINEKGYAVGKAIFETVSTTPFPPTTEPTSTAILMMPDGTIIDLNTLKMGGSGFDTLVSASDINDQGQIVGTGLVNGVPHAFLLTPRGNWYQ